jgi:hypothetical protein
VESTKKTYLSKKKMGVLMIPGEFARPGKLMEIIRNANVLGG